MKKTALSLLFVVLILTCSLFACSKTEHEEHLTPVTYTINTKEDFNKVRYMCSPEYATSSFNLNSDLVIEENWEPFAPHQQNALAFHGIFDGQNHTIHYAINKPLPEKRPDIRNNVSLYGLFGAISGATIKNLKVNIDISVPGIEDEMLIGGVVANMLGNSTLENITVNGNITVSLGDWREPVKSEDGSYSEPSGQNDPFVNMFLGGVVGYAKGTIKLNNVTSNVDIRIERNEFCVFNNVLAGGIVGRLSSDDTSDENNYINSISSVVSTGKILVEGANQVSIGLVAGEIRQANVENVFVNSVESKIEVAVLNRGKIGGVAGLFEKSTLSKAKISFEKIVADAITVSNTSLYLGGASGQSVSSKIEYTMVDLNVAFEDTDNLYSYAGGIVGHSYDSNIENCYTEGKISFTDDTNSSLLLQSFNYKNEKMLSKMLSGGIAGRVEGMCSINNVAADFEAFQGITGELKSRLGKVITLKDDTEERKKEWLADNKYESKFVEFLNNDIDGEVSTEKKYQIIFKSEVGDNVLFKETKAKVIFDKEDWQKAKPNVNYIVEAGKSAGDESLLLIKDKIFQKIK